MSEPRCSVCGVTPNDRVGLVLLTYTSVVVTNVVRNRSRTITWTICSGCEVKEQRAS